jgi:hypothetical protein
MKFRIVETWEEELEKERVEYQKNIDKFWLGDKYFKNTTGASGIDDVMANPKYQREEKGKEGTIEYMTPDEYINRANRNRKEKPPLEQEYQMIESGLVEKYKKMTEAGSKMPLPYIDTINHEQEGRHRAMVAKAMGIEKIPVLIIKKVK